MEFYNKPQETSYLLGITYPFSMPREDGTPIRAVAVSKDASDYWNSLYTILLVFLFVAAGKILMDQVIAWFPTAPHQNEILVAFINSAEPISAMLLFTRYQLHILKDIFFPQKQTAPTQEPHDHEEARRKLAHWSTFFLVTGLCFVHAASFFGGNAAGIFVPQQLMIGNMARVNPAAMFYPAITNLTSPANMQEVNARLASIAANRAIGTVEYSSATLRKRIVFGANPIREGPGGRPDLVFEYAYNLTGFDYGFGRASDLKHIVRGRCQTEYDWLSPDSNPTHDIYNLWGSSTLRREIPIPGTEFYMPPRASFSSTLNLTQPVILAAANETGTAWFSILPHTAGRRSRHPFNESHPWYVTDRLNDTVTTTEYVVRAKRPAISCHQNTTWMYKDVTVTTLKLDTLVQAGLQVGRFWTNNVFNREHSLAAPIAVLGRNLGYSNLAGFSRLFTQANRIENSVATLTGDLEHLVMGSFVYSRELVRNTVMLSPDVEGVQNLARDSNGTVAADTSDFVLESPDVQTMSVTVLISVPLIFLALWLFSTIQRFWPNKRLLKNTTDYSAIELYRCACCDGWKGCPKRMTGGLSLTPDVERDAKQEGKPNPRVSVDKIIAEG